MQMEPTPHTEAGNELYLAGEQAPPGVYQQVGSRRSVILHCEGHLPASLDGRVACYERVAPAPPASPQIGPRELDAPRRDDTDDPPVSAPSDVPAHAAAAP